MRLDWTVREVVKITQGQLVLGDPWTPFQEICLDTRRFKPKSFYLALKGKNFDGHAFLQEAQEKGAQGLIISQFAKEWAAGWVRMPAVVKVEDTLKALQSLAAAHRQRYNTTVIGVTGSNGKTTTKEMLAHILSFQGVTLKTSGNLNNHIGLPLMTLELASEHRYAVLEMGASGRGEIALLAQIAKPHLAIITNIGPAHLEFFGDLEGVFRAKRELADHVIPGGKVILNQDDPYLVRLAAELGNQAVTFGFSDKARVRAVNVLETEWTNFDLLYQDTSVPMRLLLPGRFNIHNALAAAAAALELGVSPKAAAEALESFQNVAMRMQKTVLPQGTILINDAYNANPGSMRESLLGFCQAYPEREKIAILGDMLELGTQSQEAHQQLLHWLKDLPLVRTYVLGEEMKSAAANVPDSEIRIVAGKQELAEILDKKLNASHAVLFKGSRGMGLEEVISKMTEKVLR